MIILHSVSRQFTISEVQSHVEIYEYQITLLGVRITYVCVNKLPKVIM